MRLSIHTHAGHITHIDYRTATWNMREKDTRSSVGPRPGHEAWEEVPQRPVIERVTAIVVIVIVMIIDIDIVIRPVARKHKNENRTTTAAAVPAAAGAPKVCQGVQ